MIMKRISMRDIAVVVIFTAVLQGCNTGGQREVESNKSFLPPPGPQPIEVTPEDNFPPKLDSISAHDETAPDEISEEPPSPPAFPSPPVDEVTDASTYIVRKGDTLWSIAETHLGSGNRWKEIAEINPGLNPHMLKIGQVIKLPE